MTGLRPGTSPPPVRIPIRFLRIPRRMLGVADVGAGLAARLHAGLVGLLGPVHELLCRLAVERRAHRRAGLGDLRRLGGGDDARVGRDRREALGQSGDLVAGHAAPLDETVTRVALEVARHRALLHEGPEVRALFHLWLELAAELLGEVLRAEATLLLRPLALVAVRIHRLEAGLEEVAELVWRVRVRRRRDSEDDDRGHGVAGDVLRAEKLHAFTQRRARSDGAWARLQNRRERERRVR